jgi:ferredoxin
MFCDGLGACIGECPEGAISVERREAEPYDERAVMQTIIAHGPNTVRAHLKHLADHGETELLEVAEAVLSEKGLDIPDLAIDRSEESGCPGCRSHEIHRDSTHASDAVCDTERPSELEQWPIQLHLIPATAPWLAGRDLVLSADCVAHAVGDFHRKHLRGKALAIACPKLDSGIEAYVEKLSEIFANSGVRSVEVLMMQVPCCHGLLRIVSAAMARAGRTIPLSYSVIGIDGSVLETQRAEVGAR